MADTTTEVVEQRAERMEAAALAYKERGACCGEVCSAGVCCAPACHFGEVMGGLQDGADRLRALAQERDALVSVMEREPDWESRFSDERQLRNQAEVERDAARAEVERIKAAWLFVIQAENSCIATGKPCRDRGRCGCLAEQKMLLLEHDERAALAAKEGGQ